MWNSLDRPNHYINKEWHIRSFLTPGTSNIINEPLVPVVLRASASSPHTTWFNEAVRQSIE